MMWGRRFGGASLLRLALVVAAGAATVVSSVPAQAQSAADKATARQLATQGIKLYGEGKYAQALDLLQRAQTLYDAPVHLLYIARCQHRVGQLVESAETYRG
jgi:Flp pilus assembly protein TadD